MLGQNIGKYRILDRIGRGGMGTVYRAQDDSLDRVVAIKVLHPELNDPEVVRRFRAEAVTVAKLNDPGIATIYELFQHDDQWLMVMEYVRGETLERLVERAGALAPERAAELCTQALTALGHAHRMGVVHRDLKPANLMMTDSGAVKIMDFGIARVAGTDHLTHAGHMMGTPAYMAPEQVLGHEVDARADLYSMGVVLYRLVTGKLPFKGDTPFAMAQSQVKDPPTPIRLARDSAPAWVDLVTGRALAKSPNDRFQSAEEFIHAMRRGVSGLPIDAATTTIAPIQDLPTQLAPAIDSGAPTTALPTAGLPTTTTNPVTKTSAGPATVTLKKRNLAAVAAGALVIVTLAIFLVARFAGNRQPATTASAPSPQAVAEPSPPAAPPEVTPPSETPVTTAAPAVPAPPATTPAATPTPAPAPKVSSGTTPSTPRVVVPNPDAGRAATPAAPASTTPSANITVPTAAATPAPTDPHVSFVDVKVLDIKGNKADDQDVVLNLAAGQITLVSKKGGAALRSVSYAQLAHITYTHAKDPQWDPSFSSPPPRLDIPGVFRSARHWLTLQSSSDYVILRLTDENWSSILRTVEARTGITIDRRQSK